MPDCAIRASIIARPPGISNVSEWRNSRISPLATRAPWFICRPRPGPEARIHLTPGKVRTTARVLSRLPPSTTTISWGSACSFNRSKHAPMVLPSFKTGIIIDIFFRSNAMTYDFPGLACRQNPAGFQSWNKGHKMLISATVTRHELKR